MHSLNGLWCMNDLQCRNDLQRMKLGAGDNENNCESETKNKTFE